MVSELFFKKKVLIWFPWEGEKSDGSSVPPKLSSSDNDEEAQLSSGKQRCLEQQKSSKDLSAIPRILARFPKLQTLNQPRMGCDDAQNKNKKL